MRIAIFLDTWFPQVDGVVTSTVSFAEKLAQKGHAVLIVAPLGRQASNYHPPNGIKVIQVPSLALPSYPDYRIAGIYNQKVYDEVKDFSPEIMHCQTPFSLGWMGIILGRLFHRPVVGTYHTLLPEFLMYLPIPIIKESNFSKQATWAVTTFFYKQLTLSSTPSHAIKKLLAQQQLLGVKVIPNGIPIELFPYQATKAPTKTLELSFVGRVSFEKNIDILLEGVKHLVDKNIPTRLRIIGAGPAMDSLKDKAKELGIQKNVLFKGLVPRAKLKNALKECHLAVTASTMETQGLAMLESMSLGLPCVGANAMAIPEAIKDQYNGYLFKPGQSKQLADYCEKIFNQPKLWKKLSQNARKTALNYAMDKRTDDLIDFYHQAMNRFKRSKKKKAAFETFFPKNFKQQKKKK